MWEFTLSRDFKGSDMIQCDSDVQEYFVVHTV